MDTNSYFIEIKEDFYKIIKDNSQKFDTSDYNQNYEYYNRSKKNYRKIYRELNGIPLNEYYG